MKTDDFRHEGGEFPAVFLEEEEVGKDVLCPCFSGRQKADARRIGKDGFKSSSSFGLFLRAIIDWLSCLSLAHPGNAQRKRGY